MIDFVVAAKAPVIWYISHFGAHPYSYVVLPIVSPPPFEMLWRPWP